MLVGKWERSKSIECWKFDRSVKKAQRKLKTILSWIIKIQKIKIFEMLKNKCVNAFIKNKESKILVLL